VLSVPWIYMELRARLAALLRRGPSPVAAAGRRRVLRVDLRAGRVWVRETEIEGLPAREFELLRSDLRA
jgi:DNA-binding response OmpR family regulator